MPAKSVLITGATGFIGRHMSKACVDAGFAVKLVSRQSDFVENQQTIALRDLDGQTDWSAHLDGVDHVIHLAGRAHILNETSKDPEKEFMRANAEATQNLARQAKSAGVQTLVFASSIAVYPLGVFHLDTQTRPDPQTPYGRSKWAAEQILSELSDAQFRVVNLRLPLVFGTGVSANFARLLSLAHSGLPLPLSAIDNKRNFLFVGNLAERVLSVLESPIVPSSAYLVADQPTISTSETLKNLAQSMARPFRMWPCPQPILGGAAQLLGRGEDWRKFSADLTIDGSQFDRDFPTSKQTDLSDALKQTAQWYAAQKQAGHKSKN